MNYNVLFSFLQKSRIDFHLKSFFGIKVWIINIILYMACQFFFISISVFGQFLCKKNIISNCTNNKCPWNISYFVHRDPSILFFFKKMLGIFSSIFLFFFLIPEMIMRNIWDPIWTFGHFVINSRLFGLSTRIT